MTENFFKIEPKAVLVLQRHLDGGDTWIPNDNKMIQPWLKNGLATTFISNGVFTLRGGGDLVTSSSSTHVSLSSPSCSPPFQVWILPALVCAVAYAFYNIFIKKGSSSINPILGGVVLQFVAAILGTTMLVFNVWMTATRTTTPREESSKNNNSSLILKYNPQGLFWSMAAGIAIGLAEMLSFTVAGMGVPATQFIPLVIGGSVMLGAIMGVCFLGEQMKLSRGWSGIGILLVGIILVATDQGEKVVEALHHDAVSGGSSSSSSSIADWIGPALLCAGSYASYNICIKKGSTDIHPILGGVVLQFVAALFGSILLGIAIFQQKRYHRIIMGETGKAGHILRYDNTGLFWSFVAGIAVGAAEMLSFSVSGMGVQATQSIPIIVGGSVMFGAILGVVLLGEKLMLRGCIGSALLMAGIGLVARDPGEKKKGH